MLSVKMSLDVTPAEALIGYESIVDATMPRRTMWVMSAACGVTVANAYYNQPLLSDFAATFGATAAAAAGVATAAQLGYGTGMFFLVPLGDLVERRRLILILTWTCAALLIGMATAPTLPALIFFQLLVGAAALGSQIIIPFAIDLTPPNRRGDTVGTLMAGLLCGILLARTASGYLGDHFGWRTTYWIAAVAMVVDAFVLRAELPHRPPVLRMGYGRLLHSMVDLLKSHPPLWTASIVGALSFAGFTGFWTTLSFLMKDRFHAGAGEAGMFGIVGVVGALAAPLAGKLSDRRGPPFTVTLSLAASAVAFLVMGWQVNVPGLIVGVLLMDLGVQSIQVACQSEVVTLIPEARSRLNTIYMVTRFAGAAAGSAAGALAWTHYRWPGVCGTAIAMLAVAMVIHLVSGKNISSAPIPDDVVLE